MQTLTDTQSYDHAKVHIGHCMVLCIAILLSACTDDGTATRNGNPDEVSRRAQDMATMVQSGPDQTLDVAPFLDTKRPDAAMMADAMSHPSVDANLENLTDVMTPPNQCDVQIEVNLPAQTSRMTPLFLAGTFCQQECDDAREACCNWTPGDPQFRDHESLRTESAAYFQLQLTAGASFEYKITQSTWAGVEVESDCIDIPNRTLRVACPASSVYQLTVTVSKWADSCN